MKRHSVVRATLTLATVVLVTYAFGPPPVHAQGTRTFYPKKIGCAPAAPATADRRYRVSTSPTPR